MSVKDENRNGNKICTQQRWCRAQGVGLAQTQPFKIAILTTSNDGESALKSWYEGDERDVRQLDHGTKCSVEVKVVMNKDTMPSQAEIRSTIILNWKTRT